MFSTLLPRVLSSARVALVPRVFVVQSRLIPLASRQFSLSARILAAAATATKRATATTKAKSAKPRAKKATPVKTRATTAGTTTRKTATATKKAAKKTPARKKTPKKAKKRIVGRPKKKKPVVKAKPKLPKPPAGASSPYAIYLSQNKTTFFKPGTPFTEAGKLAAAAWVSLSEEEKKPFYDNSAQQVKEHQVKLLEWGRDITPKLLRAINKERRAKKKRRVVLPGHKDTVKPLSGYLIYLSEQRTLSENWEGAPTAGGNLSRQKWFVSHAAAKWRSLPAADKAAFTERAVKHNVAYHAQNNA